MYKFSQMKRLLVFLVIGCMSGNSLLSLAWAHTSQIQSEDVDIQGQALSDDIRQHLCRMETPTQSLVAFAEDRRAVLNSEIASQLDLGMNVPEEVIASSIEKVPWDREWSGSVQAPTLAGNKFEQTYAQSGNSGYAITPAALDRDLALPSTFGDISTDFWQSESGDVAFVSGNGTGIFVYSVATGTTNALVQTGEAGPNDVGGALFAFSNVRINSSGQAVFFARSGGGRAVGGIYAKRLDGAVEKVALFGDVAPETGGGTISGLLFSNLQITESGDVLVHAGLSGGATPEGVFIARPGGAMRKVVTVGDTAPGTSGDRFSFFFSAQMNEGGHVVFDAEISEGTVSEGIFLASPDGTVEKIALVGETAPGSGGRSFDFFSSPQIGASGHVVFRAFISGGEGIFITSAGASSQSLALRGQSAPGGGSFSSFSDFPHTNARGQVAFWASTSRGEGIFVGGIGASLQKIAVNAESAPGTSGGSFFSFATTPQLNASGDVAFVSSLSSGTTNLGVFVGGAGRALQKVALLSEIAPERSTDRNASFLTLRFTGSGQAAFFASIPGSIKAGIYFATASGALTSVAALSTSLPSGMSVAIQSVSMTQSWVTFIARRSGGAGALFRLSLTQGQPELVASAGDLAPGASGFLSLSASQINSRGQIAFLGSFTGTTSTRGLFLSAPQLASRRLVSEGDFAPGTGGFFSVFSSPRINEAGTIAFQSFLTGSSVTEGIFTVTSTSSLQKVAARGDLAPGSGGTFSTFLTPEINVSGQLAFRATMTGTSISSGIFVALPGGFIQPVALRNQPAPGSGGVFSFFSSVAPPQINSEGRVVFRAFISGGSATEGIFSGGASMPLEKVAVVGESPIDAEEKVFSFFFTISLQINDNGDIVFEAGVDEGARTGIFLGRAGEDAMKVILEGDRVPDIGGTVSVLSSATPVRINLHGDVLFRASIEGGAADDALMIALGGEEAAKVVASGDNISGAVGSLAGFSFDFGFNDAGQVVFQSFASGESVRNGVFVAALPAFSEAEMNNTFDQANLISPSLIINAQLDPTGDADFFAFDAMAGQRLIVSTRAQSLGSSADTVVTLFDNNRNRLARNDDAARGGTLDSLLKFTIPQSGRYFLRVTDFGGRGGPGFDYQAVVTLR